MKKKNYELFIINIDQEENLISFLITGMAQRQRAGLITPRSQDRNLIPVFTDIAQRQSVGLITLRSQDRNLVSVLTI